MSHDLISGRGTNSQANTNGQRNGHTPLKDELASDEPIPSFQPWPEEAFGTPNRSRGSQKSSSSARLGNRKNGQVDDTRRAVSIATEFSELKDGSLVDLVEDPDNPRRTLLAIWKDGKASYRSRLMSDGKVLVPLARDGEVFRHVRLPQSAEPFESLFGLFESMASLIEQCVDIHVKYLAPVAHFVLFTWIADRLDVAPYLSIVGLPESGKTTLLRILNLVCRRALLIADITSAAFYEACSQLKPTLLIDEAGTPGNNRSLRHLLRMGTTRDVPVMRRNRIFHVYGPKVVSWGEPTDDLALNSRCLEIQMVESDRTDLRRISDPSIKQLALKLQAQLLQYRFENYAKISTPTIPNTEWLKPRSRQMLTTLAAPCVQDMKICDALINFFNKRELLSREPLHPQESAVLTALFSQIHQNASTGCVLINNVTTKVNQILERSGERFRLSARKVGAVLSTFGFSKRRTNIGWMVLLERAEQVRVHKLVQRHGIDLDISPFLRTDLQECPLCRAGAAGQVLQLARAPESK